MTARSARRGAWYCLVVVALLGTQSGCSYYGRAAAQNAAIRGLGLVLVGLVGAIAESARARSAQPCQVAPGCDVELAPADYEPPPRRGLWTPPPPAQPLRPPLSLRMRGKSVPRPYGYIPDPRLVPVSLRGPTEADRVAGAAHAPDHSGGSISATGKSGWIKCCGDRHFAIYDCAYDAPTCSFIADDLSTYACETTPCYAHEPIELTSWCEAAARADGGAITDWRLRQPRRDSPPQL